MVDYDFYAGSYLGELNENEFNRRLPRALKIFNNATFNRVTEDDWTDDFSYCICEMIDILADWAAASSSTGGGVIASTSDGVTSVSFADGESSSANLQLQLSNALKSWLTGYEHLTYSGVRW